MTSKSSFLPENPERRISRGYCGDIGLRSPTFACISGLWPVRRRGVVRGGEILIRKDCASKYRLALTIMAQEGESRIYASSAGHCRGLKVVSIDRGTF